MLDMAGGKGRVGDWCSGVTVPSEGVVVARMDRESWGKEECVQDSSKTTVELDRVGRAGAHNLITC